MNLVKALGPTVVKHVLNNLNAGDAGISAAKALDEVLDETFGYLKSENVQAALMPWIEEFIACFKTELLKDVPPNHK